MERIRCVVCGLLLVLGLSFCPVPALASDGFLGGLEDFTNTRDVRDDGGSFEESYLESYEPDLREVRTEPVRELDEDATTVDYVNSTVDAFNKTNWLNGGNDILTGIRTFFSASVLKNGMLLAAAGMCFMWWGVRKAIRMVMGAFRKGSASV